MSCSQQLQLGAAGSQFLVYLLQVSSAGAEPVVIFVEILSLVF